jgi:rhodanese-related sulfurtransferase
MQAINVHQLKALIDSGDPHQIIDIREYHEVDSGHINGCHIPMAEILERAAEIRRDIPVVLHCKSGARAQAAVCALETECGFANILLLEGGIEAWAREINPELVVY